jgi:hypothetical protein
MANNDGGASRDGSVIPQLLGIATDGVELVRQELRLARQETIEKLTPVARSSGMVLGGGMLAALGSTYLLDGCVRLLATRMPHWLASLLSGAGLAAGGVVLVRRGAGQLKDIDIVPHKTINSLREDKAWLRHQIKSRLI